MNLPDDETKGLKEFAKRRKKDGKRKFSKMGFKREKNFRERERSTEKSALDDDASKATTGESQTSVKQFSVSSSFL